MNDYRSQAIDCVQPSVLPMQQALFNQSGRNLDTLYSGLHSDAYFSRVVTPGHEYELGYPRCTCQKVLSGQITDPNQCECSRESIRYILEQLLPDVEISVEIVETILCGGKSCRFRIQIP